MPKVSVMEDTTDSQSFIISLPPEALQQKNSEGVVQKRCVEILAINSSDESMVSSSSITITDAAGGCQVSFTPKANASGDLNFIAISIADPTDQFYIPITIKAINDPPLIAAISPLVLGEDAQTAIPINIFDDSPGLTCADMISTTSSNETLLPNLNISVSGTIPNCQINYLPALNQSGSAEITLFVTDGEFPVIITILVSVTAINDPPVISDLPNQSTAEDSPINALGFSISDVDSNLTCSSIWATSSNLTLIPLANVTVSGTVPIPGTSSNCFVNLSPALNQTGSSTITLTVSDGSLTAFDTFVLTVNPVNDPPTDLSISNLNLAENAGANAVLGNLSATDPDTGDTFTYGLVPGTGSTDNTSFNILGNQLRMTASADFETKSSYSILLRTTDQGGLYFEKQLAIAITSANESPIDLSLSNLILAENAGTNSVLGNLSATDPDSADTLSYSLVPGTGSTDNTSFNILGNQLRMTASADFEMKSSYSILIRATDQGGLYLEKQFTITITDVNEIPTLGPIADQITTEDTAKSVLLTASDNDGSLSCTGTHFIYSSSNPTVVAATGAISWSGSWPSCSALITPVLNASGSSSISISVSDGTLTATQTFNLTVTAVNDPPLISDTANQTTPEDIGLVLGFVSIIDLETSLNCSDVVPTSSNTTLIPFGNITFSGTAPNCFIRMFPAPNQHGTSMLTLTISDGSSTASDSFELTVNPVNDLPTDLSISNVTLDENAGANAVIGELSASDPDTGDIFTYSLVLGIGSTDNASFDISGNQLRMIASADFEMKSNYDIRLRTTDQGGLFFEKQQTIAISNVNEAPSLSAIADQTTNQDTPTAPISLTITDVDGPSGTCDSTYLQYRTEAISVVASTGAISWSGVWPNCTAVITPESAATGTSRIVIAVSDGSLLSLTQSFNLQVNSSPTFWYQEAYLKASNAYINDFFGTSVSISGDTAIVGAYREDSNQTTITNGITSSTNDTLQDAGASYIYKRTGSSWSQEAYLKASNANALQYFGYAVSLSADTAIVGAYEEGSNQTVITNGTTSSLDLTFINSHAGASFIYRRTGSNWAQQAYVKASNANANQAFGISVSLSGDTAIVAASQESSSQTVITNGTESSLDQSAASAGASYIYKRTGSTWAQEAYLKASNTEASDLFGRAVSISGDSAIVGAIGESSNQTVITDGTGASLDNSASRAGACYIYKRTGSLWAQEAYLKASNANSLDYFGAAVSLSGDTAIVGAYFEDSNQTFITNGTGSSADNSVANAGASFIYKRSGTAWVQEAYLKASNANSNDVFGTSVSLSGDTAIVGARGESSNQTIITNGTGSSTDNTALGAGATYIYRRSGNAWTQEAYLKASNADVSDFFGAAVSISGDTAVVGASGEDSNQTVITNGTTSGLIRGFTSTGAVFVYRNISRLFEVYEIASAVSSTSFTINWKGANLGSANGNFKVVYSTTTPGANCSSGTVAYTGSATSVSVASGLTPGQSYIVRICSSDGANYSEGMTTQITVKGDDFGPTVLSITRGSTANPVLAINVIDYIVTFDEPVINVNSVNFSLTEVSTTTGATGQISSISCTGPVCTVWVLPGNTGQLRLDLSNIAGVADIWGNPLASAKTGDETFTLRGWAQEAYIKAANANTSDLFGARVSLSGDAAIVGASAEDANQTVITNGTGASLDNSALASGSSYIYRRTGTSWAQEAYLKASNANASDSFGSFVAISGDSAIIGAYWEDSIQTVITNGTTSNPDNTATDSGASYIYKKTGSTWAQQAYLKASNSEGGDSFGYAVSVSGDSAIVGAHRESSSQTIITNGTTSSTDNSGTNTGASYIYKRTGTTWAQEAYIKASNAAASDYFGEAVSLSGDTAVVVSSWEDSSQTTTTNGTGASLDKTAPSAGAGYIYRRTGTSWVQEAYIKASNAQSGDSFGCAVSLSGDTAIFGAYEEDSNQTTITNGTGSNADNNVANSGASYIYKRTGSNWAQEAYLKASNADAYDYFGSAVSVSGNTAIVGAYWEASNQTTVTNGSSASLDNSFSLVGATYIFKRTASSWTQEAYLKASNSNTNNLFGASVTISGDTVVVGSEGEASNQTTIINGITSSPDNSSASSGAVYVYRHLGRIFDPDLRVSAKTTTSITLSWASSLGTTNRVKIAPAVSGTGNPLPCTDAASIALAAGVTSYNYTGLTTGTKYAFRVCGFDGTNVSEGSIIRDDTN